MTISRLLAAAERIKELNDANKARTKAWQQLACDARRPGADRADIERRKQHLDVTKVVDFSTAIDDLCDALKGAANGRP